MVTEIARKNRPGTSLIKLPLKADKLTYTTPQCIIQKRRLMLFGHVARMDETADARRILTGIHQSDWSRPVGRPYTSWIATLKSDLSLHNLTFEDAIELALDKSLWRLLVASGATHWHGACRTMMMMMMTPPLYSVVTNARNYHSLTMSCLLMLTTIEKACAVTSVVTARQHSLLCRALY